MAGRARVVACRACRVPSCKASLIIMLGLTERVGRWQSASSGKTKPLMGGERGREKRDRVGLGSGGRRRQGGVYPTCREPQQASYLTVPRWIKQDTHSAVARKLGEGYSGAVFLYRGRGALCS